MSFAQGVHSFFEVHPGATHILSIHNSHVRSDVLHALGAWNRIAGAAIYFPLRPCFCLHRLLKDMVPRVRQTRNYERFEWEMCVLWSSNQLKTHSYTHTPSCLLPPVSSNICHTHRNTRFTCTYGTFTSPCSHTYECTHPCCMFWLWHKHIVSHTQSDINNAHMLVNAEVLKSQRPKGERRQLKTTIRKESQL